MRCSKFECFQNGCGQCRLLISKVKGPCKFFKTEEEAMNGYRESVARLHELGMIEQMESAMYYAGMNNKEAKELMKKEV